MALLAQALLPGAAMAAESLSTVRVELCTETGAKTVVIGADGQERKSGFAGLPCHDCLAASMAVVVTPELAVAPVAYAAVVVRHAAPARPLQPRARAPPRPPGQGPPSLNV
ncbi:hypothetical protein GGQ61_003852 [Phenylobacterium haematophilum]|uniref:DUF2946 domain-containing protein n=1 Tax=Phenylobacterium haematophilum TaxID=98513 RepID=A0A840A477_9CAUL|nr:hypothetical protein [Phenylobacterium haematophilum]